MDQKVNERERSGVTEGGVSGERKLLPLPILSRSAHMLWHPTTAGVRHELLVSDRSLPDAAAAYNARRASVYIADPISSCVRVGTHGVGFISSRLSAISASFRSLVQ